MRPKTIHLYVGVMCAVALVALAYQDWDVVFGFPNQALVGFFALFVLGLLSESSAFRFRIGPASADSSIIFIPLLAAILLFGPAATVAFYVGVGAFAELFVRDKELLRRIFNIAQYAVAAAVAGWIFEALGGGDPVALQDPDADFNPNWLAFGGFTIGIIAVNHAAVALAIAIAERRSFAHVMRATVGSSGSHFIHALLVSPIGILVAYLYSEVQVIGFLVSILPILFVRHTYVHMHSLEAANRDLLQALVKAIETRDPYTSGHSVRVERLAVLIGEELALPPRKLQDLKTAALLHDIGKIDVAYEEIIQKPGGLSEEERRVIESHVTRGVEIIKSLSSFGTRVVDAVRHHHERYDGNGYPDGLQDTDIPLLSRIIHVCDAIDAMLSDRPYRSALSLDQVRSELESHSGTQFDPEIARLVIRTNILEQHAEEVSATSTVHSQNLVQQGQAVM